ncbi:MAG: hypothetical protein RRB13_03890 [bacterium]|nr:hypothetical protein [bacterium]
MNRRPGMALLLTLTLLLILSIALAKSFEDRALERRHLEAQEAKFQMENTARSVLRGLIQVLRSVGYWQVAVGPMGLKRIPAGAVVPLGEGGVSNLTITPMDQRFNLSGRYDADDRAKAKLFEATLGSIYRQREQTTYPANVEEVIGAISDFEDTDQDPASVYGVEQYPQSHPAFQVKNAELDQLSEVKVIPAFQRLGLTQRELEQNFRVLGDPLPSLDVNSASKEEIVRFIEQYSEVGAPFLNLSRLKDDLVEILSKKDKLGLGPYFDHPFVKRGQSVFERELAARGLGEQMSEREKGLFKAVPDLLEIRYNVHYGEFVRQVTAQLSLEWGGQSKSKTPSLTKVVIERFEIR